MFADTTWTELVGNITPPLCLLLAALAAYWNQRAKSLAEANAGKLLSIEQQQTKNAVKLDKAALVMETVKKDVNSQSSAAVVKTSGLEDTLAKVVEMTKDHPQHDEIKQLVASDKAERDRKAVEIVALAAAAKAASDDDAAKAGTAK